MEEDRIAAAIESALLADEYSPSVAGVIAFHMTDWLSDLERLTAFYESPDGLTDSQISDLLMAVLVHVPNHLNAAARLLTDQPVDDVFGIGATLGNGLPPG